MASQRKSFNEDDQDLNSGSTARSGRTFRINVNLSEASYDDLIEIAAQTNRTFTEVVRTGLGLVYIAHRENQRGNTLTIADRDGRIVRELVLLK